MKLYLRAFLVGSSFPVVLWPFLYLGISFTLNPGASIKMGLIPITIPIIMGLVNTLYVFTEQKWSSGYSNKRLWLFGGLYGLVLSLFGNFVYNVPIDLFQLSGPMQYIIIPIAITLYSLIWRYIIKNLNKVVGIS